MVHNKDLLAALVLAETLRNVYLVFGPSGFPRLEFSLLVKESTLSVNNVIRMRAGLGVMAPRALAGGMERELLQICCFTPHRRLVAVHSFEHGSR